VRVAVAADHAGFPFKDIILALVKSTGNQAIDMGTNSTDPVDYPDYAEIVGRAIQDGEVDRGILICGSGVGAAIAANKVRGIRAGLCHDTYSARQSVEHDDTNVLALGARVIGVELAIEIVKAFLRASFSGEERHRRRVNKIIALEHAESNPEDK
jgi:RpiB/LacA/LacB family sugar-phosphate isomerase